MCLSYNANVNKTNGTSPSSAAASENMMLLVTQDAQPQSRHGPGDAQIKQDAASECLSEAVCTCQLTASPVFVSYDAT